jgi:aryl-alcohol dehydrogenase-like predicted oxidoreductase
MEQRRLGRTGHQSSVVAFGSAALKEASQETADRAIELALEWGVNHFDVAPRYGDAELRLAPWMPAIRSRIFLACKTAERTKEAARAQLHRSLERLGVDYLDLYQLHAVRRPDELEACLQEGGALEALLEARDEGLVGHLGITGHTHDAPSTFVQALTRVDCFDTVMFPLNFVLWARPDYRQDARALLELCLQRDVGVQVIKAAAKGPWGEREPTHVTWYEPFQDQGWIDRVVAFSLSQPGVATLCSAGDVNILPMFLAAAERFRPLNQAEQDALLAEADQFATPFVGAWA